MAGAFVHMLTLTDIASTCTDCAPLLVRERSLVVETIDQLRGAPPFVLRGVDIDNGEGVPERDVIRESAVRECLALIENLALAMAAD